MRPLAFVDTETTGLSPKHQEVYEIAISRTDDGVQFEDRDFWVEPIHLQTASSDALPIGRFYERRDAGHEHGSKVIGEEMRWEAAMEIARFTEGCHLVGAKPDFDARFLDAFLRNNGAAPAWHHRLIDVESLAIGLIVGEAATWGRPMSLSDICAALDIERQSHTARGDCYAMRQAYFKLMEMAEQRELLWRASNGEN